MLFRSMAKVYEAKHESLGHIVAIKFLKDFLLENNYVKNLFVKEARFLATLQHENIIRVIDAEELPHQVSIIMEYVNGKTLKEKVETEGYWVFGDPVLRVPFEEVTEEMVIEWVREDSVRDGKNIIESRLEEQINALGKQKVVAPWLPQVFTPNLG